MKLLLFFTILFMVLTGCGPQGNDSNDKELDQPKKEDTSSITLIEEVFDYNNELTFREDSIRRQLRRRVLCYYLDVDFDIDWSEFALDEEFEKEMGGVLEQGELTNTSDELYTFYSFEGESCGAYCNPFWETFIINNETGEEVKHSIEFSAIDEIYIMDDGKYLIREWGYGRPASTYSVECAGMHLAIFEDGVLKTKPILGEEYYFGYCQEMDVQMDDSPYAYYDEDEGTIEYYYGNNYLFNTGEDIDTIRRGTLVYENGIFVRDQEEVKVIDKR